MSYSLFIYLFIYLFIVNIVQTNIIMVDMLKVHMLAIDLASRCISQIAKLVKVVGNWLTRAGHDDMDI